MTTLGFRHTNEVELWSPYTNQAFSAPPVFSIENLIYIAQTRVEALGNHLWFLQTEPAYMRRYIRVLCQGEFYKAMKKEAAGDIVTTELFKDVSSYWHFSWIKASASTLRASMIVSETAFIQANPFLLYTTKHWAHSSSF
jgi:hypothetical protein